MDQKLTHSEATQIAQFYEDIQTARRDVMNELELAAEEEAAKATWWSKFCSWIGRTTKHIVQIACTLLRAEVLYIINNPQNQLLAKVAVLTAIKLGLKNKVAWNAAWVVLTEGQIYIADGVVINASKIKTNILETLLQLVYTCLAQKNQNGEPSGVLKDE